MIAAMKTNDRTASEMIDHIAEIIKERQQKNLPTYYTICIEQYEKTTPVAEKEEGYENFKAQVLKYMSDYNLTALLIQLFHGKSFKVKQPFQTYKIVVKKQEPKFFLSGVDQQPQQPDVQQMESVIPVARYYDEKFETRVQLLAAEMEKQRLISEIARLTERYEDKLKQKAEEINELQSEVTELEQAIEHHEYSKSNSLGNITLGGVGAHALESFAKSRFGISLIKSLLGETGFQTLQGHLNGTDAEQQAPAAQQQAARIIAEEEPNDARSTALRFIKQVAESMANNELRLLYEIVKHLRRNRDDLMTLFRYTQQLKDSRNMPVRQSPPAENNSTGEDETESRQDDELPDSS